MKNLKNKVAVVTGAASGIGQATALLLAEKGARLAITDLDAKGLEETATEARKLGAEVSTHLFDMADREAVYGFADEVISKMGQVDLVINNAGVALGRISVQDVNYEDFEWVMNINFWGMVHGTKAFLPHLISRPEASIVNVSSLFGLIGVAYQAPYCATKFAIRGFTESLRMEMMTEHPHVIVTSVHPGGIKTSIAKNSRWPEGTDPEVQKKEAANFEKLFRTTSAQAAKSILRGVRRKKTRVLVGSDAKFIDKLVRLMASRYSKIGVRIMKRHMAKEQKL